MGLVRIWEIVYKLQQGAVSCLLGGLLSECKLLGLAEGVAVSCLPESNTPPAVTPKCMASISVIVGFYPTPLLMLA